MRLRALAAAYAMEHGKTFEAIKSSIAKLSADWRTKITNMVRKNKLYESDWVVDPTWTSELEDGPPATTYVEWVDCLVRPKRWIDEPMLAVGATLMQRSIVVFVWSASSWPKGWVIDTLPSPKKHTRRLAPSHHCQSS